MQFPLQIVFKLLALAPQIYVRDAQGREIGYVRQKLLAFKEAVTVFADDTQANAIYQIKADRIIDFNANYTITDATGRPLGSVRREGVRSLWRAHYEISIADKPAFAVNEASALVRLLDNLLDQIPFVGILTGYFLNPTYLVTRHGAAEVMRMVKRPSFLESTFTIELTGTTSGEEQQAILLGLMMIVLLERSRG